jgi:hypothetical protein
MLTPRVINLQPATCHPQPVESAAAQAPASVRLTRPEPRGQAIAPRGPGQR